LIVAAGVRSVPSVLIVPLEHEFGWSRATISFAIGLNIFLYGLIGPFAAAVMDRFGLRRTMLAALAFIAAGVALTLVLRRWVRAAAARPAAPAAPAALDATAAELERLRRELDRLPG